MWAKPCVTLCRNIRMDTKSKGSLSFVHVILWRSGSRFLAPGACGTCRWHPEMHSRHTATNVLDPHMNAHEKPRINIKLRMETCFYEESGHDSGPVGDPPMLVWGAVQIVDCVRGTLKNKLVGSVCTQKACRCWN